MIRLGALAGAALVALALAGCVTPPLPAVEDEDCVKGFTCNLTEEEAHPGPIDEPEQPVAVSTSSEQAYLDALDPLLAEQFDVSVTLMRAMPEYEAMADSMLSMGYSMCPLTLDQVLYVYDTDGIDISLPVIEAAYVAAQLHLC